MADIFDNIATSGSGDIFNKVAPSGDIFDRVAPKKRTIPALGTGGVAEALMEPAEIPGPVKELAGVVKAGISGGARAASELALFPIRAAGEIATEAAERPAAFEGVETTPYDYEAAKERFRASFQGGLDKGKALLFGESEAAKMVEEGVSLPFEPVTVAAGKVGAIAKDLSGDPLVGKLAEYGALAGIFKLIHAAPRRFASKPKFAESVKSRMDTLKKEIPKEDAPKPKLPDWDANDPRWDNFYREIDQEMLYGEKPVFLSDIFDEVEKLAPTNARRNLLGSESGTLNTKVISDFKEFWQPFSTVPEGKQYMALRYRGMYGGLARVDRVIKRMSGRYKSMPDQAKKDVFNAVRGELPMESLPPDLQRIAKQTRGDLNRVGKMLVKRGMLSEETFLANKDQYIHYLYLRHILPDEGHIPAGRGGRLDLSYLKQRKDLTELQRKELGLIEDVSVAAPVGVGKALGDMVKADFFREVSANPEWVWQPSKEIAALTKEHKAYRQIMERAENVTPEVTARFQQLDAQLKEATASAGKVPADFVQIPDSKAYGDLAGAFVRREIANDVMPIATVSADAGRLVNTARKVAGGGMTMFKVGKVALNPPTMVRNMFSNLIQINMSGVPFYRVPPVIVDGLRSMKARDAHYRQMQRLGGFQTNFSVAEIGEVLRIFEEAKGGSFSHFYAAVNRAAKYYGRIDDVAKMALYKDAVTRLGMEPVEAAIHAQKWGMDYSLASRSVKYARRYALPFVSYQYKIAPLVAETLANRPWVIAKYAAIPYLLAQWASTEFDWSDKDLDKAQKMMAARTKGQGAYILLPVKDNKGNVEIVNLEYFLPWGNWLEVARSAKGGEIQDALKPFGFGGPFGNVITMLNAKRQGEPPKDPFTGQPVYSPLDSTETQYMKMAEWWWQVFGPSSLSSRGAVGYSFKAIAGEKDKWGTEATLPKAAARWLGVNVGSLNPQQVMAQKKAQLSNLEKEMRRIMRDPAYSKEKRKEALKRLREQRQKIIKGE